MWITHGCGTPCALLPGSAMKPARYLYAFTVRPARRSTLDPAVLRLFEALADRVELDFTADEFERFRASVADFGLTLHEVERVPYLEPEPVP